MHSNITNIAQHAIDNYLDALEQAYGRGYRERMIVEFRGASIMVKHPDVVEGELLSIGNLNIMTRNLREQFKRQQSN